LFVANDPINKHDAYGLEAIEPLEDPEREFFVDAVENIESIDPDQTGTMGVSFAMSGSLGILGGGTGNLSLDFVADKNGDFDILLTPAGGGGFVTNPGGNVSVGITATNASSVEDLEEGSFSVSKSAFSGLGAETENVFGKTYQGVDIRLGMGTPGAEITGNANYSISLIDVAEEALKLPSSVSTFFTDDFGPWLRSERNQNVQE